MTSSPALPPDPGHRSPPPSTAGRPPDLIRPFIVTGGRTRSQRSDIRIETMVRVASGWQGTPGLAEAQAVLYVAEGDDKTVAEIAAHTGLPLGVVTILVGDLADDGAIEVHHTDPAYIEVSALTRMIERVRAL